MSNILREDVLSIVLGHHERDDGGGYPKKLKANQMSQEQKVLQIADTVTGMINKRNYRKPLDKDLVIVVLSEEAAKNRLDKQIVNTFVNFYDNIMMSVEKESAEVLRMYQMLNSQYAQISKRFKK